jgi:hypothetical protein
MIQVNEHFAQSNSDMIAAIIFGILCLLTVLIILWMRRRDTKGLRGQYDFGNVVPIHRRRKPQRPQRQSILTTFKNVDPRVWFVVVPAAMYALMLIDRGGLFPDFSSTSSTLNGRVSHVRDGDTIVVSGIPIRFAKLDCAELGTVAGERAKRRMIELASSENVQCYLTGRRSYDRMIGECSLEDGRDLSRTMISEGYCSRWW